MNIKLHPLTTCRICGSDELKPIMQFADMPMPEGHKSPGESPFLANLTVHRCCQCGVVQTQQDLELGDYYQDYPYSVSQSPTTRHFMQRFALDVWERFNLKPGDVVVEIGSGDGCQLREFKNKGARVLGFEPSISLAEKAVEIGVPTIVQLFDSKSFIHEDYLPIRLVISQYTFDHLPDPVGFLSNLLPFLDSEEGLVVFEVHDFEKIVERCEACLFTHEHTIYPTVDSMEEILSRAGFRLVCTDLVPEESRRGNSLIVAGTPKNSIISVSTDSESDKHEEVKLLDNEYYELFASQVWSGHHRLAEHIRYLRRMGKKVAGYGAAGRGVNTLVIAGLKSDDLDCVYDMNPALQGLLMPGSSIPVRAPTQAFEDKPDEIIVFSYGYIKEVVTFYKPLIDDGVKVSSMLEYLVPTLLT